MTDKNKDYDKCIKKKTQEYLKKLGKKTFTLDDLAAATEWASEQCHEINACEQ